jgi:hypothetical protein
MRVYGRNLFSYLGFVVGEWHSKTRTALGGDAPVSPHPTLSQREREIKNSYSKLQILAPYTNISGALHVDPICPIIRFTMLLGYGYYDDCLFINAVNQRIRKTGTGAVCNWSET